MAGKINAYYDGISKEIQAKCQAFSVSVEHKIELEQSLEEDYKTMLLQDINEIKEIEEIVDSNLPNEDKEDTYKECMRIVDSKINNFNLSEFQNGATNSIKLDSFKYSLTFERNEEEKITCTVISKESGIEFSTSLSPSEAIEFLNYMDNLGFGDMETKIELAKEFLDSETSDTIEKDSKEEIEGDSNFEGTEYENNGQLV